MPIWEKNTQVILFAEKSPTRFISALPSIWYVLDFKTPHRFIKLASED
jgi:hypothetical protein